MHNRVVMAGAGPVPLPLAALSTYSAVQNISGLGLIQKPEETGVQHVQQLTSPTTAVTGANPVVVVTTQTLTIAGKETTAFQYYNPLIRATSFVTVAVQGMVSGFSGEPVWPVKEVAYFTVYNVSNGGCTVLIHNADPDDPLTNCRLKLALTVQN
jgi:hypothetical protein